MSRRRQRKTQSAYPTANLSSGVLNRTLDVRQEKGFPGHGKPPNWVLDREADRKIDGGYTHGRNREVCPVCFVRLSNTGECLCD